MNKKFTKLIAALALLVFMAPSMAGWGQSDYSTTYTSGVTLSTSGGTSATVCKIIVTGSTQYDGIKAGTGSVAGAMKINVPSGTKYLHIHVAGWKGETVSLSVTPDSNISPSSISLTSDDGISSNTPFTLDTPANAPTNYYKVITFTNALTSDTQFTFAASSGKRFVIWGVNAEEEGPTGPTCTVDPDSWNFGEVQAGSSAQQKQFTVTAANLTSGLGFYLLYGTYYSIDVLGMSASETSKTITVTLNPTAVGAMEDMLVIEGDDFEEDFTVDLTATGLCNAPATALAYTSPVNLTLSGSSVGCTLNPTANTGNGGAITYAITQGDVNHGILVNNEFEADALGTWVVTATQAVNGTTCGGTADITINVYGPEQTITFDAGTGTSISSMTAAQGSTIQLPSATPSAGCVQAGWTFAGWTDEAITETTTAPDILLAAGDDYTVTTNETLYAVYMQGGSSTCSVTFSESGYANEQTITDAQIGDCSTATFDKGTNSNAPKYYNTGTAIRCYGGNTITIAGEALTEIVLTFGSGDGSNAITTNVGSYSNGTWTGSANSVVFTIGGTSGNRRIAGISVTCGGTATYDSNPACLEKVATPVITLAEGTYTEVKTTTITCETEGATIYYTTDGTDPTDESTEYTGAITIGQSMTLKAIAVKENMENSNIASATYTINIQYTLTINNENGNIRDIHVFDDPTGIEPILYIDGYSGEELTEASIDAGTAIYVSVGGVVDCKVFDALTVTCGGSTVTPSYDGNMYSFTLNGNTSIAVSANDADEYTLTVAGLEHVSFDLLVGSESDIISLDANHQATVCEQVLVEVIGLTVGNGFSLQSVTLAYGGETQTITPEFGVYAFNMPSSNATLTFTTAPITAPYYALYSGALTEGDYLIVYGNKAMNNTVESNRLQYETVTVNGTSIMTDDATIIWHIAPSGDYWTIYNAAVNKYAAATGSRNQAQLLSEGTDDKALWTATGNTTYEFENKARAAATSYPGNKWLRNNGTNGFACYSDQTGGALSLYKKVTPQNYTTMDIEPNQWYFIASPTGTSPIDVNVLSDLYYYDEQDHHWRNQKVFANAEGFVNFDLGKGYLCANTGEFAVTLTFTGVAITANSYSVDLDYHATTTEGETNTLAGWNLVGNPFTSEAYIVRDYYVIGNDATTGKSIIVASEGGAIAPYTGVMVQAEGEGESVTFTTNAPENPSNGNLQMTVAQQVVTRDGVSTGSTTIDNAIVSFNEGSRLGKFYFGENDANIYIPQNGKEYAIVSAEAQGEMPVNFRAAKNGTYTLTINPEGVEMNYLHLIDNMTGANIDLLQTPSYTFNASMNDYESRFKLVFAAGSSTGSEASETFAFFANGELIVSNEGEATLQVVDMTGRILSSQSLNGNGSVQMAAPVGVYVLRLISGNEVKTQKIVVR
jgi:hypothetical protein